MSDFILPTARRMNQDWAAEFDDWDGDGVVDYPGGFYNSIGWAGHNGLDFLCPTGDPVYASGAGTVEFAGTAGSHWLLSGGGNVVLLAHASHRVRTEYLHLSRVVVTPGSTVAQGQLIGYAGATGAATGAHLHFGFIPMDGVNLNNRMRGRINPHPFLAGGLAAQSTPIEEDEMPFTFEDLKRAAQEGALAALDFKVDNTAGGKTSVLDVPRIIDERFNKVPGAILDEPVNRQGGSFPGVTSLRGVLAYSDQQHIEQLQASAAAAHSDGVTVEAIIEAVRGALAAGVRVDATVTVGE